MEPNNAQQYPREFRFEGPRLERTRRHTALAEDQLKALTDHVLTTLGSKGVAEEEIGGVLVYPNTDIRFFNKEGKCVGRYVDPPGICTTECDSPDIPPQP